MAFFLEEREGSYMKNLSGGGANLGPGQYDVVSSFGKKDQFRKKNVPAFGQSVKKESFFNNGSYNPAPG
jgi:hypothetical protein